MQKKLDKDFEGGENVDKCAELVAKVEALEKKVAELEVSARTQLEQNPVAEKKREIVNAYFDCTLQVMRSFKARDSVDVVTLQVLQDSIRILHHLDKITLS